MSLLSKANQDRVNTWKSNIDGIPEAIANENLMKYHEIIYKWIQKKYTNINTKKSHLSTLAVLLRDHPHYKEAYSKYSSEATQLNLKSVEESKKQKIAPGRDYVSWENDIIKKRDELKAIYEADRTDNKKNQQYLIACLYTMQPPVRMDYKDMKIVKQRGNKQSNFIVLNDESSNAVVHINKDKVSATHGPAKNKLSKELTDIIRQSLKDYPREYLLSLQTDPKKPIGKQGFETLMTAAFSPLKVSVDILRSSFISYMYAKKETTLNDKTEIAKLMRTSVTTSDLQYSKPSYEKQTVTCPHCHKTFMH